MSIQEYIEEHALGKKVEDVINAAVKAKAAEPISFMVRALPAISIFARHRSDDYRAAVSSGRGAGFGTEFARVFTTERSGRSSTPRNCRETTASSVARRAALERRSDQPTIGTIFADALRRGEKIESDLRKSPWTSNYLILRSQKQKGTKIFFRMLERYRDLYTELFVSCDLGRRFRFVWR